MTKTDACEITTARILDALKLGSPPWRKPWDQDCPMQMPMNARTKKPYQGINVMLLWLEGRKSPYWATKKAWMEIGANVQEDAVSTEICFYAFFNGRNKRVPFMKVYEVFNALQVDGHNLENQDFLLDFTPAENIINESGAVFKESGVACYDHVADIVYCPAKERFLSTIGYYTTKLHELAHWTGKRLNRNFGKKGSSEYAFEELIAELTSCFLAAHLEIPEALEEMPNHASYLQEWLQFMEDDKTAIFRAASAAQKATNYLLGVDK